MVRHIPQTVYIIMIGHPRGYSFIIDFNKNGRTFINNASLSEGHEANVISWCRVFGKTVVLSGMVQEIERVLTVKKKSKTYLSIYLSFYLFMFVNVHSVILGKTNMYCLSCLTNAVDFREISPGKDSD